LLARIDTNILVSALWVRNSGPAQVVSLIQNGLLTLCYDYRILAEYNEVLRRAKFSFDEWEVAALIAQIENDGLSVVPPPIATPMKDEEDRMFFEVAKHCGAKLITGNRKHYPEDELVTTVAAVLAELLHS